MQEQPPEKFCKKAVLKNFAIFRGQHLCWRLFLIQNIAKFFRVSILKNICERLLLKMFIKPRKIKNCWYVILTLHEEQDFSTSISETSEIVYLFAFISWLLSFWVCIYIQYFFDMVRNKLQTIDIYTYSSMLCY